MAIYKVSYLMDSSYSNKGEHYVNDVVDEYDAIEKMINMYNLPSDIKILNVDFISE